MILNTWLHHNSTKLNIRQRLLVLLLAMIFALNPLGVLSNAPSLIATASAEETAGKALAGKTISIMGDSISTYTGWSDLYPITDPDCAYRYGEAYYGPAGGDFHNTELLVTDTWWHQAATELGADILMVNSGNSTGLLHASYPASAEWEQYLQDMLAYKSRPYYLDRDGKNPDIIALYIGSNDVAKADPQVYGSIDQVDFSTLITGSNGSYSYAAPTTVAEAYCILLHKVSVTYPDAEIYCFTAVPNAGGYLSTCNSRLASALPFNKMVKGVAAHYGAIVVDLMDAFQLDPDEDGIATEAAFNAFKSHYNDDPHPNASGFDVITDAFVSAIRENSRYMAQVETAAGLLEDIPLAATESTSGSITRLRSLASNYVTPNGMIVNYEGQTTIQPNGNSSSTSHYTSSTAAGYYRAEGGAERETTRLAPSLSLDIPLVAVDDSSTTADETTSQATAGSQFSAISGDRKQSPDDGVYDYTITSITLGGQRLRPRAIRQPDE